MEKSSANVDLNLEISKIGNNGWEVKSSLEICIKKKFGRFFIVLKGPCAKRLSRFNKLKNI